MLKKIRSVWQRLSNLGVSEELSSGEAKRIQLTNRIGFVVGLSLLPYLAQYISLGIDVAIYVQIFTSIALISTPLWNYFRYFTIARFVVIGTGAFNIFLTSSVMGFESGEHAPLLLLVLVSFILFGLHQKWYLWIAVSLGFICWFVLEATGHAAFGKFNVSLAAQHESYVFNFTLSMFFVAIIAYYFQGLSNRQVDDIIIRAQRELKAVFDNSFDAIFLISLGSHEITSANERSLEMFGLAEREDFIGKLINQMRKEPLKTEELVVIEERLQAGDRWSMEAEFRKADQSIFWGSVAYTFVKYGEKQELLVRITDVTEKKAAELAIIEAKEKAEEANRAKDNFMANMSHEIRTPINGIIGLAEIIEAEAEDEELQSYADLVLESGHRLLRTLGSILDLTRLEAQDVNLSVEPMSIDRLFEALDNTWRDEATNEGLYLEIQEPASRVMPILNRGFVEQSLGHIISNAIKFTDQGGVTISAEYENDEAGDSHLKIIVSDTGIGMSEKFITKKLFMKFEQESDGLDRNYEGSGLGLSIVKRVVELMDGHIEVQSVKGEGSQFILSFPVLQLETLAS